MRTLVKYLNDSPLPTLLRVALIGALLVTGASAAGAIEYWVSGQVLQVSEEAADDETIADAALSGTPRPWVRVRVFDRDTATLLGEVNSNENGQFTVRYDRPPGSTPNIECRVVHLVQDPDTSLTEAFVLRPAREEINNFSAVPRFFLGTKLKVLADDALAYGTADAMAGLSSTPGLGAIITRVGKVEIQFIAQNTTAVGGLADFSSDPTAPASLGVADFRQAPFGGKLFVFGEFGPPQAPCAPGDQIDYYRVMVRKPGEVTWRVFKQPLPKTKTTVSTTLPLTILHQRGPVGPFTGNGGALDGLYWVNRNDLSGGPTYTVYSFPDLRVLWNTNARLDPEDPATDPANGLYEIQFEYYKRLAGDLDNPTVMQLAAGCFQSPTAPVGQLYVRVENRPITATLDNIYLRDPSAPAGSQYFQTGGGDGPIGTAHDFASVGLCDIMELAGRYSVEIHYTVNHPGGYLRAYSLRATANDPSKTAVGYVFPADTFSSHTTPGNPLWSGPGSTVAIGGGFETCAYEFALNAHYRQQDGYHFRTRVHRSPAYYVDE